MSFFCPCISWMQLPAGSEQLNSNDRNGDEEETTRNDKKQYHGLRLVGDADSEPVQFNMMRLKEDVVSDGTCKSPLLHMILNTKNVISNKIQQGREIASDSITMVYNNSSSADIDREESSIKGTQNSERSGFGFILEKNREAECVICLVEFSEGNPKMLTLCGCGEHRANFHYPCLLIYLQKKKQCPVCNQELFYQELTGV